MFIIGLWASSWGINEMSLVIKNEIKSGKSRNVVIKEWEVEIIFEMQVCSD